MNIIIIGCGKVGKKLVEQLGAEEEHNITVVDSRYPLVQEITAEFDAMGVVGNAMTVDTLTEAGVQEADIVIAVTGSDEQNMLACLMAKKLGNCGAIARVREPEYNRAAHLLKEDLGISMVINPELAAASEIARVLRFPSAIKIDTFAKGRVEILKFRISENSVLDGMRVSNIVARLECDVLVCGVERENEAFIPDGSFVLQSGDLISIVSSIRNAALFFKKIGFKTHRVKDTIIVGGGNMAYYLAHQLLDTGIHVKIIEQNQKRCDELCQLLPKATIVCGDGTDNRLLLEEGLETAESIVSLMNIDEENILLSLYAQSKTKGKIVTKINRIAYGDVITRLDLDTTVYPKNITADYIVRFVRAKKNSIGSNIETMHLILEDKAEALEFRICENSPVANITIDKLKLKKNILIACISRGQKVIIPRGRDTLLPGDTVIVVTLKAGFQDISDILE
ncbi:MAG: Trk system potassium transporter TrkA [Clostridia bacterium]|nr:Trk system potassium transporter TrkA [Clostridia bacterium]